MNSTPLALSQQQLTSFPTPPPLTSPPHHPADTAPPSRRAKSFNSDLHHTSYLSSTTPTPSSRFTFHVRPPRLGPLVLHGQPAALSSHGLHLTLTHFWLPCRLLWPTSTTWRTTQTQTGTRTATTTTAALSWRKDSLHRRSLPKLAKRGSSSGLPEQWRRRSPTSLHLYPFPSTTSSVLPPSSLPKSLTSKSMAQRRTPSLMSSFPLLYLCSTRRSTNVVA